MVPDLSPRYPPDQFQLAALMYRTHWVIEQGAYDLSRGAATREQLDQIARAMEGLALLLREHDVGSMGSGMPVSGEESERQKRVADVAEAARREELPPKKNTDGEDD